VHRAVLLKEVIELMQIQVGGTYIDGTLGAGGHTSAILAAAGSSGRVLSLDRDARAIEAARPRLEQYGAASTLHHANFAAIEDAAHENGIDEADGILLDLGMSSDQVDCAQRGFSFQKDGPLDMRMDESQPQTAEDIINGMSETELANLFWRYGEERASRRIAKAIVRERGDGPITSTARLAEIVSRARGGRRGRTHPATQTFQALRMAVNAEMDSLEQGLNGALELLKVGGRLAVISFHSIEDREVKHTFVRHAGRMESLQAGGQEWVGKLPRVKRITRKPVMASVDECKQNPRARSAKLRVVEGVSDDV